MKIALAQIQSDSGKVDTNIDKHLRCIDTASEMGCDLIVFPELSITGYEPSLSEELAFSFPNSKLDVFQNSSDEAGIRIAIGLPLKTLRGVQIGMKIFQPHESPVIYSKRYLHKDEEPYFVAGEIPQLIRIDSLRIAPAICYESTLIKHAEEAAAGSPDIYLASVAKPENGVKAAKVHYAEISQKYGWIVLMANAVGPADNFINAGQSGVWLRDGSNLVSLKDSEEALLIFDVTKHAAVKCEI